MIAFSYSTSTCVAASRQHVTSFLQSLTDIPAVTQVFETLEKLYPLCRSHVMVHVEFVQKVFLVVVKTVVWVHGRIAPPNVVGAVLPNLRYYHFL